MSPEIEHALLKLRTALFLGLVLDRDRGVVKKLLPLPKDLDLAVAVLLISLVVADLLLPLLRPVTKTTLTFEPLLGFKGRSGAKVTPDRSLSSGCLSVFHVNHIDYLVLENFLWQNRGSRLSR